MQEREESRESCTEETEEETFEGSAAGWTLSKGSCTSWHTPSPYSMRKLSPKGELSCPCVIEEWTKNKDGSTPVHPG